MADVQKLAEERKRTRRADEIVTRIDNIVYSLGRMESFVEVRIVSGNDSTWQPKISHEKVKAFVRDEYEKEMAALQKELDELYPESGNV